MSDAERPKAMQRVVRVAERIVEAVLNVKHAYDMLKLAWLVLFVLFGVFLTSRAAWLLLRAVW